MSQDKDDFFQEQKDWSKRKLSIIQSYLASFTKILGSSTSQSCVYYVDGFAGKGIYSDGSKGSPVLAAELAQKYRDQQKKYLLNCINVESDDENFQNLENATSQYSLIVENLKGTFSTNIPLILNYLGRCPTYFFIDPFGVKGTDWVDMVKIIHRIAPTDLWLRFDHKIVRRLCGFFESGSRGADGKVNRLLKLYGAQRADNLFTRLDGNSPEERIDNAVYYYVEKLEEEFRRVKKFGFSAAFPIVSLEGQNKYYLVFAASHPKAAIVANETIYSVERNRPQEMEEYRRKKTGQLALFSSEPDEKELSKFIAEELSKDIWQLCSGVQIERKEIYLKLLNNNKKKWFGNFSGAHLNLALLMMEKENMPRLIKRTGVISKNSTRFEFR